jgi:hypothetical protein
MPTFSATIKWAVQAEMEVGFVQHQVLRQTSNRTQSSFNLEEPTRSHPVRHSSTQRDCHNRNDDQSHLRQNSKMQLRSLHRPTLDAVQREVPISALLDQDYRDQDHAGFPAGSIALVDHT